MELQWPLILFTAFVAWSAGLFASQCALALKGECAKVQMPAWITSAVLLAIGGVAVFLHLEHWERIFNGFGHLTSGITQELIAIVVLAVVAVVYLVYLRRNDNTVPAWLAVVGIVVCVVLVLVMAHSYLMASRPAWNTPLWLIAVLGNACVLGPATLAVLAQVCAKETSALMGLATVVGSAINAVASIAYVAFTTVVGSSFSDVGYYADPTRMTEGMVDTATVLAPFAGESTLVAVLSVVAVLAAIVAAVGGKKTGNWTVWGVVTVACALVGAVCVRLTFYMMGSSTFLLF